MPQFDFQHYPSQLFWLAICFFTLLVTSQFLILPRIRQILNHRNRVIDDNLSEAAELNNEIESLKEQILSINSSSVKQYKDMINEAQNSSKSILNQEISHLKTHLAANLKNSRQKIDEFLLNSSAKNSEVKKLIIQNLQNKFLN